jgi:hypothetical protein
MLEGIAGKITTRMATDEFAHAPPLLASASAAGMGRDQNVGQVTAGTMPAAALRPKRPVRLL